MNTRKYQDSASDVLRCIFFAVLSLIGSNSHGATATLALSGDAAPGGGTLGGLNLVKVNDIGQAMFEAFAGGDEVVLRAQANAPLVLVARSGQSTGNGTLDNLNPVGINNAGQVVFDADIDGSSGGGVQHGIYLGSGGTLSEIVRTGDAISVSPQITGEFNQKITGLTSLSFYEGPVLNDTGQVTFAGHVSACNPIIDGCMPVEYDAAIRSNTNGTFSIAAKTGTVAPLPGGGTSGTYSGFVGPPVVYLPTVLINNAGQVLYRTTIASPDSEGIFWANVSSFSSQNRQRAVARNGQTNFPGPAGTMMVETETGGGPPNRSGVDMNDAGDVAFVAELHPVGATSADHGVFLWSPQAAAVAGASGLTAIARSNQASPDGNGTIGVITYSDVQLNNKDQVAFSSQMVSPTYGAFDSAIIRGDGQTLSVIARRGMPTPDGQLHFGYNGDSLPLYPTAINDSGQVAFQADLGDANDEFAGGGIYISDGIDTVEVTRKGQALAGSTVSFVSWQADGGFNSLGQVAYQANLADGRTGTFLYTPQDIHWRTAGNGNWDTNTNWTLSMTPGSVHDISIDPNISLAVSGPAADVSVHSLTVGKSVGVGIATLNLRAGANLSAGTVTLHSNATVSFDIGGIDASNFARLTSTGSTTLGGTLAVSLVDHGTGFFVPAAGEQFTIITAFGGITPGSQFAAQQLPSVVSGTGLKWLVQYTSNNVTLEVVSALLGDYNGNGIVDAADYVVWRNSLGQIGTGLAADGNNDGVVNQADSDVWRAHFGQTASGAGSGTAANAAVPEPATMPMMLIMGILAVCSHRRVRVS